MCLAYFVVATVFKRRTETGAVYLANSEGSWERNLFTCVCFSGTIIMLPTEQ